MKFFRWFNEKFNRAPANRVVSGNCNDKTVDLRWADGTAETVSWNDVQRVVIRTTNKGRFDEDVFFVLETDEDTFVIPQESDGLTPLLERLQRLPGFDNEAFIESMSCTENKLFLCWERSLSSSQTQP